MASPVAFGVQPEEAIDFLRRKMRVPTRAWTDLWEGMHSAAFVVAGAQSDALLADFQDAVDRAITDGRTLEQFRQDFDGIVAEHGWSYNGSRGWRSRVIFETNLRMAYSAGRWEQIQRLKDRRPYLRYVTMDDDRVRHEHRAWHNVVLPVDHPWWQTHFPPNGWGCRCYVQSLNERDLKRYGLKVWDEPPPSPWVEKIISTPQGKVPIRVPQGIDPGFAYNPGAAGSGFGRGTDALALERHGPWDKLDAPGTPDYVLSPLPVDQPRAPPIDGVRPGDEAGLRDALRKALNGDSAIAVDPIGARVHLSQAIVDHMIGSDSRQDGRERYFGLMTELIEDPAEIWIGWARSSVSGRVVLRQRYVKIVDIGGGMSIGMVADTDNGTWSGMTFFRSRRTAATTLRTGFRIYQREK